MVIPGGYLVTSKSLMTKGYHRGVRAARDGTCEIPAFWAEGVRTPAGGRGDSRARVARRLPAGVKCSTAAAAVIGIYGIAGPFQVALRFPCCPVPVVYPLHVVLDLIHPTKSLPYDLAYLVYLPSFKILLLQPPITVK